MAQNATSNIHDLAVSLALTTAPVSNQRVAAVCYDRRGVVWGIGRNSYKTHPMQAKFGPYPHMHAEMAAMVDAMRELRQRDLRNYRVYVARVTRGGKVGLAKPCEACEAALKFFKVAEWDWSK